MYSGRAGMTDWKRNCRTKAARLTVERFLYGEEGFVTFDHGRLIAFRIVPVRLR